MDSQGQSSIEKVKIKRWRFPCRTSLRRIRAHRDKEITSERIGQTVMEELKQIDPIAYFRLTSVHKQFHAIRECGQALKGPEQLKPQKQYQPENAAA